MPPNARDTLYQSLPPSLKSPLKSKLQSFHVQKEVFSVSLYTQISRLPLTLFMILSLTNLLVRVFDAFNVILAYPKQLTVTEIQEEMEKTLQWLVPVATNTVK